MNIFYKTTFFVLMSFTGLFSQEPWIWQNPLPQGNNLNDVFLFDDNAAIAIGNNGAIIDISADGQIEQVRQNICNKTSKFNCIHFIDDHTGFIGGDGFILKSVDGGATWNEIELDSVHQSRQWRYGNVYFINDSIGWISGYSRGWSSGCGNTFKTVDGGENWTLIIKSVCKDLYFIDPDKGWAVFGYVSDDMSDFNLWNTSDGGNHWTEICPSSFDQILFLNDSLGWGAGGSIFKTTDGGHHWQTMLDSIQCYHLLFLNENDGWAIINKDSIIVTHDGGITWSGQKFNDSAIFQLNALQINNNNYGIAVGNGGHIRIKKENSSDCQSITNTAFNGNLQSIAIINKDNIWACGSEYEPDLDGGWEMASKSLIHSSDGGNSWEQIVFKDSIHSQFNDMSFLDEQTGWAVGQDNVIIHTEDGGKTWNFQSSGLNNTNLILDKIFFIDHGNGWILGNPRSSESYLFSTQDGGQTWDHTPNHIPHNFAPTDIHFVNRYDGWMVGRTHYPEHGRIYHTSDGGKTWQYNFASDLCWTFTQVQFLDSLTGWVAGGYYFTNGKIIITENGGQTWAPIFDVDSGIVDFVFLDKNHGWVITNQSWYASGFGSYHFPTDLYYTENGGQHWENLNTIPASEINSIAFVDLYTGWAMGANGMILKTNSGGATGIKSENMEIKAANDFNLFQNYPNPFNPRTVIRYSLPVSSEVELSIYNLLGQKVATLVSGKQPAGNHSVSWNASGFSSGVYFYRLETSEGLTKTKKLIYIK